MVNIVKIYHLRLFKTIFDQFVFKMFFWDSPLNSNENSCIMSYNWPNSKNVTFSWNVEKNMNNTSEFVICTFLYIGCVHVSSLLTKPSAGYRKIWEVGTKSNSLLCASLRATMVASEGKHVGFYHNVVTSARKTF